MDYVEIRNKRRKELLKLVHGWSVYEIGVLFEQVKDTAERFSVFDKYFTKTK